MYRYKQIIGMKRREFGKMAGMGLLAIHSVPAVVRAMQAIPPVALAREADTAADTSMFSPPGRRSPGKVPLGLCDYALRGMRMKAMQSIEYAIEHRLDSVLFNSFRSFESLEPGHLARVNELAKSNGISVYIGAFSITETSSRYRGGYASAEERLKEGIRVATAVGSPIVATRIGMLGERYSEGGIGVHINEAIRVMKSLRGQALDAGVKFAMENHQDLRSEELLGIIHEVGPDVCGALFDPANTVFVLDDPMRGLRMLGSHILATSARDFTVYETAEGATMQCTVIGQGVVDYRHYVQFFADHCPGVPIHVETIDSAKHAIPFLKKEFWDGFPGVPASGIIDFLTLIRQGRPVEIPARPEGMEKRAFEIEQQQKMLHESLDYLRGECGAGVRNHG